MMNDNEIIQSLECCATEGKCKECPAYETYKYCLSCVLYEALDLIYRQKSKIEALQMDNAQLQSDIVNANMNCEHVQAEIERLKCDNSNIHRLFSDACKRVDELDKLNETVKPEAIKEFAERLKENTLPVQLQGGKYKYRVITVEGIEHFEKEMVGEGR